MKPGGAMFKTNFVKARGYRKTLRDFKPKTKSKRCMKVFNFSHFEQRSTPFKISNLRSRCKPQEEEIEDRENEIVGRVLKDNSVEKVEFKGVDSEVGVARWRQFA